MKKSELLRQAKKYLWDGKGLEWPSKTEFVCCAISRAAYKHLGDDYHPQAMELREWINGLLGKKGGTLCRWLENNGYEVFSTHNFQVRLQQTRKDWLNWMIAYWEEKGE